MRGSPNAGGEGGAFGGGGPDARPSISPILSRRDAVSIMMFNFVASLVIILVAAYAMYRLIELPSQRYKNRLTSVPSAPKTA